MHSQQALCLPEIASNCGVAMGDFDDCDCTVSSFELPSFDIPIECIQGSDALPPQVSLIALIPLTLCPKFGKARNPTGDKNKIKVPQFGVHQTVTGRIRKAILMEVPGFVLF